MKYRFLLVLLSLLAQPLLAETRSFAHRADLSAEVVESGAAFLTPETRALQEDDFANPGYLWVDRGRELFAAPNGAKPCDDCHREPGALPLTGAATRYPQYEPRLGRLLNLAGRINQCRVRYQDLTSLKYESDDLLALSAYVANLSRGRAYEVRIDGPEKPFFEQGRAYFFQRRGQLNLACNQCHDDNWGRLLRGDRVSQGHPNAWPGYRLEWQTFGSLHRRLQDCDVGVRAQPSQGGSAVYTNLELYLTWRARQLPLESPGVRR